MSGILNIGVSALLANQRVLNTVGHNIANVNTDGYSRQRVQLVERAPQFYGFGFVGKGVDVSAVERVTDHFLTGQLRASTSNEAKADRYLSLTDQVDRLLGNGAFSPTFDRFFGALQDANGDPSSIPARQVLLSSANALAASIRDAEARLSTLNQGVNDAITAAVDHINGLTAAIADLNRTIALALGEGQGAPPNDLLDQREQLLLRLSEVVGVTTLEQDNGAVNVFIGTGQLVVAGSTSNPLRTAQNALDRSRLEVALDVRGTPSVISAFVNSGDLGGILAFRDEVLDPARNAVGRIAAAVTMAMNGQHRAGMDLNGAQGADLFSIPGPRVAAAPANAGAITVALNPADLGRLTVSDYRLTHNGVDFTLTRLGDGAQQTLSGAGPFNVDGITIAVTAAPAAGDEYLIQPTKYLARNMSVVISDAKQLALARPIRTGESFANIGTGSISPGEVLDATDPNMLAATQLVFNDPPTTFQINGAGPLIPYVAGANIDVNGWRVRIDGAPGAGDTFSVEANFGGTGDNANGLRLADLQLAAILEGATTTFQGALGQLIGDVGTKTQQAQISRDALATLRINAQAARDRISGVNLDEEAANLLRFQQAYQASAQVIQIASRIFEALLDAVR